MANTTTDSDDFLMGPSDDERDSGAVKTIVHANGHAASAPLSLLHRGILKNEGVSDAVIDEFCKSHTSTKLGVAGIAIKWRRYDEGQTPYLYIPKSVRTEGMPKGLWNLGNKLNPVTTHSGWFRKPKGTKILIVEGTIQSLAAASWAPEDWGVVGIQGCRGLHKSGDPEMPWAFGADVMIAFDADRDRNPDVKQALTELTARLRSAGARTVAAWNLPQTDGVKTGLDDFLKPLASTARTQALLDLEKSQTVLVRDPVKDIWDALMDSDDLDDLQDPTYLITNWLTSNTINRINGEPNAGKSLVALDWAGCVGTGTPWMDNPVEQGTVLYVIAEGAEGFKMRKRAWEKHYGKKMTGVKFFPKAIRIAAMDYGQLTQTREWTALREVCKTLKPGMIVLDTQRRVTTGIKENDNTDFGVVVEALEDIRRETQACVLLAHHTTKGGEEGSGAGAVKAAVYSEFLIEKRGHGLDAAFTLKNDKEKDGLDGDRLELGLKIYRTRDDDPFTAYDDDRKGFGAVLVKPEVPAEGGQDANKPKSRVQEVVDQMDAAGLPVEESFRGSRSWLLAREVEINVKREIFEDAVRFRKARAKKEAEESPED